MYIRPPCIPTCLSPTPLPFTMLLEPFQATTHKRCKSSSTLDTSLITPHPITLVPVEILSEIMCYMPLFYDHDAPSNHSLDPNLDPSRRFSRDSPIHTPHWVAVSHVCRHWRRVALKCKALWTWTCVPLVSLRWAQRALTLSHLHPITLRIESGDNSANTRLGAPNTVIAF
jgi:F-box-like